MALWTLEALPGDCTIDCAVLLGAALAPTCDLTDALGRTECGLRNFASPLDLLFPAGGAAVCGTSDGTHGVSAGHVGFVVPTGADPAIRASYAAKLHEVPCGPAPARQFHLGGHFGWTHRVFVAETLAPIVMGNAATTR